MAYCLMGLFDVHMPPIYGEGGLKAFRRLQIEIMQVSFDQTLFAWRGPYASSGLLAHAPSNFVETPDTSIWGPRYLAPYSMTNVGLSIHVVDVTAFGSGAGAAELEHKGAKVKALIQCDVRMGIGNGWQGLAVYLEPVEGAAFCLNGLRRKAYRRVRCSEWYPVPGRTAKYPFMGILVLEDAHEVLVINARLADFERWGKELPLPPGS